MAKYKRVLLKLSGESLMGKQSYGIDPKKVSEFVEEIKPILEKGVELGIVIGGGNIFRGLSKAGQEMDRTQGDFMGMLATVINAMALQSVFLKHGISAEILSGLKVEKIADVVSPLKAKELLANHKIVIFAGGTGNPFFTTDTGAVLRALEIDADAILKGTRVDGIYDKDPEKYNDATKYKEIGYDEALQKELKIMDTTAFALAKDNKLPIIVFDMNTKGNLLKLIEGKNIGTIVH
jgi:uridylate kinase